MLELKLAFGWNEADLEQRSKNDGAKIELAARLRQETTLTIAQIAQRLRLGHRNTLKNRLCHDSPVRPTPGRGTGVAPARKGIGSDA